MATSSGRPTGALEERFHDEPYRFEFFQAVRLLERFDRDRMPVGRDTRPEREVVRFEVAHGLTFPASQIQAVHAAAKSDDGVNNLPVGMKIAFMGLTGPLGVLPTHYSELVAERQRAGDESLASFLNIFNHRLISLFYRAWEKYRPAIDFERNSDDALTNCLYSLIGLGLRPLRDRFEFPDATLLGHAGTLANQHRSVVMLERSINESFNLPVEIQQFQPQWLKLDEGDRSVLGASGQHNCLGQSLVLGDRVRDLMSRFRLRLGPLYFHEFEALLPGSPQFRALCQFTRLYIRGDLQFEVQLILGAAEVPACQLGSGSRLGRTSWLKSRPFTEDAEDAVFAEVG